MNLNLLDYFILLLLILGGISGYQQGLIRSLGAVVNRVMGLGVAGLGCNHLALYLDERFNLVSVVAAFLWQKLPLPVTSFPPLEAPLPSVSGLGAVYTNLAYLLLVVVCFLALYLLAVMLGSVLWTVVSWLCGWGILGAFNQAGGTIFGIGWRILSLTVAVGLLLPLVEAGARLKLDPAITAQVYLDNSTLIPYLTDLFTFFSHLLGLKM